MKNSRISRSNSANDVEFSFHFVDCPFTCKYINSELNHTRFPVTWLQPTFTIDQFF